MGTTTTLGSNGGVVFEGFCFGGFFWGGSFVLVWFANFALTALGVGAGGPFSAICDSTVQLYFLQYSINN